jgi:DNA-directed RNA polymerase specialized sigma subunit
MSTHHSHSGKGPDRPSDKELLRRIREQGDPQARDLLIGRYLGWARRTAARFARKHRLRPEDVEDARAEAFPALEEAIDRYDPARAAPPNGDLGGLLLVVLYGRLGRMLRRLRRDARYLRPLPAGEGDLATDRLSDPAVAAQCAEWAGCLGRALADLDDLERRLYELLSGGMRPREARAALGLSPDRGKRLRQKMLKDLRAGCGGADGGPP